VAAGHMGVSVSKSILPDDEAGFCVLRGTTVQPRWTTQHSVHVSTVLPDVRLICIYIYIMMLIRSPEEWDHKNKRNSFT
jgi:hypothetical protein